MFSQINVDSLENILPSVPREEKPGVLNELAKGYWYRSPEKTISYASRALSLARELGNRQQEATALLNTGNGYLFSGQFDKAINEYLKKSLELSRDIKYQPGISGSLNSLAAAYMNKGEYKLALNTFLEALQILRETNDAERIATVQINIASIYTNWGIYDQALEYYLSSLKIFEQKGNQQLISRVLNNIAVAYHSWGNLDKALDYYFKSLNMYEKAGDKYGMAVPLNNIGEIYKDSGKYDKALEYYHRSLDIAKETNNQQYIGVALLGLGEAHKQMRNTGQALSNSSMALKNFEQIGFQEGEARAMGNIAEVYKNSGDYNSALYWVNKSLALAVQSDLKDLIQSNRKLLADIYNSKGDYKNALHNHQLYSAIKDSVFNEQQSEQIARMQTIYETQKTRNENELLRKKNQIQLLELSKQENLRNYLIIISGLVFILVIVFYSRYRTKKHANLLLERRNGEIASKNEALSELNQQLQTALNEVKKLSGLLPICSHCKKVRDDKGYWNQIEVYIREHSEADFSHGICPDCMTEIYPEYTERKDSAG